VDSSGDEIADFAARYGLVLMPWQRRALRVAMGERADGRWAAGEVAVIVPRQNGKGAILEARELAGLFLLGEGSIVHTAQQFRTATDAFKRIRQIIEGHADLKRRVLKILNSPVEKSIELVSGQKLWFIARGPNAGRGLSSTDCLIFDEAYDLTDAEIEALAPTMTVAENPQVWYTSSAGLAHSVVLSAIRKRGIEGSPTLAYQEWSVPQPEYGEPLPDPSDPHLLAMANPSLGLLVTPEYLATERGLFSSNPQGLARERLGVFDAVVGDTPPIFPVNAWEDTADAESTIKGRIEFGIEVAQDRSWSCIGVAGRRPDGLLHVQVAENHPGTDWVVGKLKELGADEVALSPNSPAGSLAEDIEAADMKVVKYPTADYAAACGRFYDLVVQYGLRHLVQGELERAVAGAAKRTSGDAYLFDRKGSTDISPLSAVVLAAHLASLERASVYEERGVRFL
jgi:hypothetical protein